MKKILICPDSFKGTLSSIQAANAIKDGINEVKTEYHINIHPIADGGEGTLDCISKSIDLKIIDCEVLNPIGKIIKAQFGITKENDVIIEMAISSGLTLLSQNEKNPFITSTFGVGQLIKKALDYKPNKIIIGIGGSATNDCGIGMAQALGVKFLDESNNEISYRKELGYGASSIEYIDKISIDEIDSRIKDTNIIVCCDVSNKLLGKEGASFVYGGQKGAKSKELSRLDELLSKFNKIVKRDFKYDLNSIVGGGAAGGLGAGLIFFLDAKLTPGLDFIAKLTNLENKIKESQIVITGEGCMDIQTQYQKAPVAILNMAKKYDKKVFALNGRLKESPKEFDGCYGTNNLKEFDNKNIKKNAYYLLNLLAKEFAKKEL